MPYAPAANDARRAGILEALRKGSTRKAAADLVGVSRETLYTWAENDITFSDAVRRAEAESQCYFEERVHKLYPDDRINAENARWWLERRRRADYGPSINLRQIPTETLAELLQGEQDDQTPSLQTLKRTELLAASDRAAAEGNTHDVEP